jgi:DNA-binding NarL/FixJ family response regulator
MKSQAEIRLLIVDDHFFVRMGLAESLNDEPDLRVVAEAGTSAECMTAFAQHHPDVVLLDLNLPDGNGIDTLIAIRRSDPNARFIMLSVDEGEDDIHRAVEAGARAYLPKSIEREDLLEAVRAVAAGETYFPARIAGRLRDRRQRPDLTGREMQVLSLIVQGCSNKEAAANLGVTEPTIKQHVGNILRKLEVLDRTQAVTAAIQRGLVRLG